MLEVLREELYEKNQQLTEIQKNFNLCEDNLVNKLLAMLKVFLIERFYLFLGINKNKL